MIRRSGGLALVLVVGVLGVLAVLAASFVTLARFERKAVLQRLHATKARMLARSGIEDVFARLSGGQDAQDAASGYGGEDWDASGGPLDAFERQQEAFRPGVPNGMDCPVRHAMRPSFFRRDVAGEPCLAGAEGRKRGCSGRLREAAGSEASYAVKVEDESGKIDVNGGLLDAQDRDFDGIPDHRDPDIRRGKRHGGWNGQLTRILNLLGDQPEVGIATLGDKLLAQRPVGGYRTLDEVAQAAGTSTDLSPYLTLFAWSDPSVIHPNGDPAQGGSFSNAINDIMTGREPLVPEEGGRPPVNLNAASRPVLDSLIENVSGTSSHAAKPVRYQLAGLGAPIADAWVARRSVGPFRSWQAVSEFLDGLVDTGVLRGMDLNYRGGGNHAGADLLKSNFDPNTGLAKHVPDQLAFRWIDKSDLLVWSTEGSLWPTGAFSVQSVGRILDVDGRLLAEVVLGSEVLSHVFRRQTTQRDFVAGRSPDASGESYLSLATDPLVRMAGATASWNTWGKGQGLAAVTYPSPMTACPDNACDLDGSVGLATVELEPTYVTGLRFLHHFDDGWEADDGGAPLLVDGPDDASIQKDPAAPFWAQGEEPNTLLPDGFHAQWGRSPCFTAAGNMPGYAESIPAGNRAVFSYWVKPSVLPDTMDGLVHVGIVRGSSLNQVLLVGMQNDQWGIMMENRADASDAGYEQQFHVRHSPAGWAVTPGHRWHLVTAWFDTNEASLDNEMWMAVWGARGQGDSTNAGNTYRAGPPYVVPWNQDITQGSLLSLGAQSSIGWEADHVLDEMAILDFGDVVLGGGGVLESAQKLQAERYRDGRYYKGEDAVYRSPLLDSWPGQACRVLFAFWTSRLPKDPCREFFLETDAVLPVTGVVRPVDAALGNAGIEMEIEEAPGAWRPLVQGVPIHASLEGIRYRARFLNRLADPDATPVLETPFLDDVTFAVQPAWGPVLRAYGEGRP